MIHHIISPTNNLILNRVLEWSLLIAYYSEYDNYIVLESEEGEYVGYLMYYDNHIYKLEVKETHRKLGYGKQLIQKYEDICVADGIKEITLTAMNFKLISFYEKLGFVYNGNRFDNMKKNLIRR